MTDGEKFALKRRLKERYAWDKRRVYEIAEEEINNMKKTPTIAEILDKISAEIKDRIAVYDSWTTQRECTATEASTMREALAIVKKYMTESEDKAE